MLLEYIYVFKYDQFCFYILFIVLFFSNTMTPPLEICYAPSSQGGAPPVWELLILEKFKTLRTDSQSNHWVWHVPKY